jgi:hypothetical protein
MRINAYLSFHDHAGANAPHGPTRSAQAYRALSSQVAGTAAEALTLLKVAESRRRRYGCDDEAGGVRTSLILFWLGVAFHGFPFGESGRKGCIGGPCGPKYRCWGLLTGEG